MVVAPAVADFARAYPDVRLEVAIDDTSVSIIEQDFDVGLRLGEMIAPDMVAVRVSPTFPFVVVGAPACWSGWAGPGIRATSRACPA
jgi:DNA-binding transcriptional LysR family regulator